MAYRSKAKTIVQAVTRAEFWRRYEPSTFGSFTAGARHNASMEACRGTKVNRRLTYVETAEYEESKHVVAVLKLHGSARAAVIAGRYERNPTW